MSGKEAGEGAPKLWILHSMRIKAIASAKVINLPVVLITTLLLFSHSAIRVFNYFGQDFQFLQPHDEQ